MYASRIVNYLIFMAFIAATVGLFLIKNTVSNLNYQLNHINKQIIEEKNKIYLLKAEIAYLTSPEMLRSSAYQLGLESVKISQIIRDPLTNNISTENKFTEFKQPASLKTYSTKVKWRFKGNPNKFIQQTAMKK